MRQASPVAVALATWFGCGFAPIAPGTVGTVGALIVGPLWQHFGWSPLWLIALTVVVLPASIWAAGETARGYGKKDPGLVVVDEVLGMWITLAGAVHLNWKSVLAGFILFRLLDITKPWPVRKLEALPGGTGIVADDLGAGILGALVLYAAGCFNLY